MKMDGNSKRKLSKRKDPELALTFYKAEGFPVKAVYEYIMTILNSNFEDWRRANPDTPAEDFKFSPKKLNPAGSPPGTKRAVRGEYLTGKDFIAAYDTVRGWEEINTGNVKPYIRRQQTPFIALLHCAGIIE